MKGQFKFPKHEHLKSTKAIAWLFRHGRSLSRPPIFIKYDVSEPGEKQPVGLKAAFTVSRRNFKRAVDRNRIKRLMREAFRLNAAELRETLAKEELAMKVIFVFTGKEMPTFEGMEKRIPSALAQMLKNFSKSA